MKKAVITGASSGIGLATVRELIENDFEVLNLSRSACALNKVTSLQVDLSDLKSIQDSKNNIIEFLKGATQTLLIHCAGVVSSDCVGQIDISDFEYVFKVNVTSALELNNICVPFMPEGSCIAYVGSTLSEKAVPGCASYVISKHAVIGAMKSTSQDLSSKGIHSLCICPGFTDTKTLNLHLKTDENIEIAKNTTLLGRLLDPREIGEALVSLSLNPASNGGVFHLNGGQLSS